VAYAPDPLSAVGAGLPANATLAERGLLGGDGQRFAFGAARGATASGRWHETMSACPKTLAGLHLVVFAMLVHAGQILQNA
jgi:hypothetical protein